MLPPKELPKELETPLSWLERAYVNSIFRHVVQRPLELWWLGRLARFPKNPHLLDLGCGNGRGLVTLARRLQPVGLAGVEPDARQLAAARRTLARAKIAAQLVASGAEKIALPAHSYDMITSFGCLHHVPVWRDAVREVGRLLRHGGLFYALEFYAPLLEQGWFKRLARHPADRFTHEELVQALQQHGMTVLAARRLGSWAGLIVARRTGGGDYD